jgi:hypothetical protein
MPSDLTFADKAVLAEVLREKIARSSRVRRFKNILAKLANGERRGRGRPRKHPVAPAAPKRGRNEIQPRLTSASKTEVKEPPTPIYEKEPEISEIAAAAGRARMLQRNVRRFDR